MKGYNNKMDISLFTSIRFPGLILKLFNGAIQVKTHGRASLLSYQSSV